MRHSKAILCVIGLGFSCLCSAQVLESIRLSSTEDRTRLVFDVSSLPGYRINRSTDPSQLLIDLETTTSGPAIVQPDLAGSAVQHIALTDDEEGVHVVLSLAQPDVVVDDFVLKPYLLRGNRIVLDFYPATPQALTVLPEQDAATTESIVVAAAVLESASEQHQAAGFESAVPPAESLDPEPAWPFAVSGTWEQEWAGYTEDGETQKFEATIEPRLDLDLASGASLTTIFRLRIDTVGDLGPDASRPQTYSKINGPFYNNANAELSLREIYLDAEWAGSYWRVGKQQVVWGQADGIKVLDVVNPQSYREFILDDFDDSRIPLTMLNLEVPLANDSTLQLLWIPDTTYHELAEEGTPYFLTAANLVPQPVPGLDTRIADFNKPDDPLKDSEAGVRYSSFWGGWDVTLNYLYHYQDFPVLYQQLEATADGPQALITPEYERNHLVGGTLSNALGGDLILRAELAFNSDSYHVSSAINQRGIERSDEVSGVLGLDWQLSSATLVSGQYFQSSLLDYANSISRDKSERNLSVYLQQYLMNETLELSALLLYSVNKEDTWTQLKVKYMLQSNLEVWLGADVFSGDVEGVFGQFKETDRVLIGLKLGF